MLGLSVGGVLRPLPRRVPVRWWEEEVKVERPEAKPRTYDLDLGRASAMLSAPEGAGAASLG